MCRMKALARSFVRPGASRRVRAYRLIHLYLVKYFFVLGKYVVMDNSREYFCAYNVSLVIYGDVFYLSKIYTILVDDTSNNSHTGHSSRLSDACRGQSGRCHPLQYSDSSMLWKSTLRR